MSLPGIGVFGTGPSTSAIVPHLRKEGFNIEAIWGKTTEDAENVAQTLDIPFSTSRIDDVLLRKDVDLILVLCPPSHHSQIAVKALGIGKHVAVLPPVGISQNETLRMVQAAQYYPSLISIALYGLRFLPAFVRIKQHLSNTGDASIIGKVTMCDVRINSPSLISDEEGYSWACDEHMGGGILNQIGSHVIDLLQYLTNFRASRVHGTVRTLTKTTDKINGIRQISSDDLAVFQMECHRDRISSSSSNTSAKDWSNKDEMFVTVTLTGCSQQPKFYQEILICGTKAHLIVRNEDLYLRKKSGSKSNEEILQSDQEDLTFIAENNNKTSSSYSRLPEIFPKGTSFLFRHLSEKLKRANAEFNGKDKNQTSNAIQNEQEKWISPLASFDDALYVQAVMEAIRLSSKEKSWAKVSLNH